MSYDHAVAQKKYRSFKSRLTRLQHQKNHQGIIDLYIEFRNYYTHSAEPMPDLWHRWLRAAEDATYALSRQEAGL